ncbi:hypothetical protein F8388_013436 [Cannabis sativa]|uniref:DUF4283 domain-containing protein n=1 Tax=Cannabis sativa TaxID=3483 RepID=A0A7J6EXC9_CANSA|nr:hypothetical protein F8388_013436 [Cannabis sativa]KAF4398498.1 hypothetical protein G4B88_025477 [Cannabis sativa]
MDEFEETMGVREEPPVLQEEASEEVAEVIETISIATEPGENAQEVGEIDDMKQQFLYSISLELEPDVELSAEVTKKGVLAKTFGRRSVARGRVKEILSKIWKLTGNWRMKTLKPGLLGIFFDDENDKIEVLKKRPWLVNGALLNIIEWPEDSYWEGVDMNKARYWVEAHGLPTPYLTWENTNVIARKVGEYIDFDRAPRAVGGPTPAYPVDKGKKVIEGMDRDGSNKGGQDQGKQRTVGPTQIVVSHDNVDFSSIGPSFSGAKKRKASLNVVPVIDSRETVTNLGDKPPSSPITLLPPLEVNTFTPGSCSRDVSSSKRKPYTRHRGGSSSGNRRGARQGRKCSVSRSDDKRTSIDSGLGFRKTEDMNKALLTKFVWQMASRLERPWVDCFLEKYCKNSSFCGVWKSRNGSLFKGCVPNILQVRECIMRRYAEAVDMLKRDEDEVRSLPSGVKGRSVDKSFELFAISDAAWKEGKASIAVGLLDTRINNSVWRAKQVTASSAAEAELLAIQWAVQIAVNKGVKNYAGASDAKVLMDALKRKVCPTIWNLKPLALEVLDM